MQCFGSLLCRAHLEMVERTLQTLRRNLERIIQRNEALPLADKVQVVSPSLSAFSEWPDYQLWTNAVQHAAAQGFWSSPATGLISR